MVSLLRNWWIIVVLILAIAFLSLGGWWYWMHRGPQLDALIRETFSKTEEIKAYGQAVQTETTIEDRRIRVVGKYLLDDVNGRFSSRAETTLTLPDGASHSFNLETITIGDIMYVRVESKSPALNLTVPASREWKQFKTSAIPPEYRDIATPRPPVDNLTLFKKSGEFLEIKEGRKDEERNGEKLAYYTFGLSPHAFTEKTGPVSMIAERVGVHGTIEVWVRESDARIRYIRFSNEPYVSETTIIDVDTLPPIAPPTDGQ